MLRKLLSLGLAGLVLFFSIPYLSGGVSVFIGKWAYDWGVPVYTLKFILVAIAAVLVILAVSLLKKIGIIIAVIFVVLLFFFPTVLDQLNITSNPGEIITSIKEVAIENRETIVTATQDLFYQSVAYATEVNPVKVFSDYASGEESFWYLEKRDVEVDFSQEIFKGYKIIETKEIGEFKAYRLEKTVLEKEKARGASAG